MKITKQRLKEIIKEEVDDLPTWEGEPFGEYDLETENEKGRREAADDAYQSLQNMVLELVDLAKVIESISMEHGAFVHVNTYAKMARAAVADLRDKVEGAILERDREY